VSETRKLSNGETKKEDIVEKKSGEQIAWSEKIS